MDYTVQNYINTWLKNKKNYIYYNIKEEHSYEKFYIRMIQIFLESLMHTDDHDPAPFYILTKSKKEKEASLKKESFKRGKNTGKSLNQQFYRTIQELVDKVHLLNHGKSFTKHDKINMFYKHIGNFQDEVFKQKIYSQYDYINYRHINGELSEIDVEQIDEFLDRIFQELKRPLNYGEITNLEYKEIEEIALYYPVQYTHNIFDGKHYLFEINPYKFKQITSEQKIQHFLFQYFNIDYLANKEIFHNAYEEMINLHHGVLYDRAVSYFNPYKLLEPSYEVDLSPFTDWLESNNKTKNCTDAFYTSLLETLNEITFHTVKAQFESLLNSILMKEYNSKNILKKDFVEFLYLENKKKFNKAETEFSVLEEKIFSILGEINEFYKGNSMTKNNKITAEDLNLSDYLEKGIFEYILKSIDLFYNKHKSLDFIYDTSVMLLKELLKSYNIPQKLHKAFEGILLDIVTFETASNMKMPFNSHIEMVHRGVSKKKLLKEYNFTFEL